MNALTFDEGILSTYQKVNVSENGEKPVYQLKVAEQFHYGTDTIYYKRFFTIQQAGHRADVLLHIPGKTTKDYDVVVLEDGKQYSVLQEQPGKSEGLDTTWITLERIKENYEFTDSAQSD